MVTHAPHVAARTTLQPKCTPNPKRVRRPAASTRTVCHTTHFGPGPSPWSPRQLQRLVGATASDHARTGEAADGVAAATHHLANEGRDEDDSERIHALADLVGGLGRRHHARRHLADERAVEVLDTQAKARRAQLLGVVERRGLALGDEAVL